MMYNSTTAGGDLSEDNNADFYTNTNNTNTRPRFPGLYVGNLTWWTTDQDVINNINGIGVNDTQEVKFFENRNNGQSKGFCVVTFNSEASLPVVMEKLPKIEIHGQNPVVTHYNRQNLNLFESQTKSRPQMNNSNSNGPTGSQHAAGIMGISSISGVHANTQGLPYSAGGMNNYNSPVSGAGGMNSGLGMSMGGPRNPYNPNMRMQMRGPRPGFMRGSMPNSMNNGPMMPRIPRFMQQPQAWNNSQNAYNPNGQRMPQVGMDVNSRLSGKPDDLGTGGGGGGGQDMMSNLGPQQNYYAPHHSNSQSDQHYRGDLRDDRERDSSRRIDDRLSRPDDRSLRHHDDRPMRHDDRSLKTDDRSSSRRGDERSSSRRGEEGSSSRREDSRREERSSRREKDSSSSSRRDKSHRSDERARSRSREKSSRDRSRERKERRDRRDRY